MGGKGADVTGDFALTAGEVLSIVVSGVGGSSPSVFEKYGGGGSGGSFVVGPNNTPLLVAGGGGGQRRRWRQRHVAVRHERQQRR